MPMQCGWTNALFSGILSFIWLRSHQHSFYDIIKIQNQKWNIEEYRHSGPSDVHESSSIKYICVCVYTHMCTHAYFQAASSHFSILSYHTSFDVRGKAFGTLTGETLLAAAEWGGEIRFKCGEQHVDPSPTFTHFQSNAKCRRTDELIYHHMYCFRAHSVTIEFLFLK